MKFEDLLATVGGFGRYQQRIIFLLCLPAISCGLHRFVWVFLGAIPDFRCRLPFEDENSTFHLEPDILNMSYPWDSEHGRWHSCKMLKTNFTVEYYESNIPAEDVTYCEKGFVYDDSIYKRSIATDYNLVCHRLVLHATTQALFMMGTLIGSFALGAFSDRSGRRQALLLSLSAMLVCGILAGAIPDYFSFTALRMIIGGATSGVFLSLFVIGIEISSTSKRTLVGTMFQCFFAVGYLLTALFAYIIRDWQILEISISVVGAVFVTYFWFIPESPRWLIQAGKVKQAEKILKAAAKENNMNLPPTLFNDETVAAIRKNRNKAKPKWSLKEFEKYPNLRYKLLIVFFNWFVISGVYYGISLNTSNLGDNDFINFVIFAVTEIPAYLLGYLLLDRFGRRSVLCGSLLIGGITFLLIPITANKVGVIVLAMIGKFGLTSGYNVIYIFSSELMPTVIRNAGLGACSVSARFGGMIAPYLLLLETQWKPLPYIVFGIFSIIASVIALILPETANRRLPETMEDGERFGKASNHKYSIRLPPEANEDF
ncbi:hypothetical protein CHUAL_001082 [Chamberlinius hualienensis]